MRSLAFLRVCHRLLLGATLLTRNDSEDSPGPITGGGNGIGRAASAAFARHGAKVVVVDRDGAAAEATAGIIRQNGGDATAVTADVTRSDDVKAYVKAAIGKYGRIDCFQAPVGNGAPARAATVAPVERPRAAVS